MDQELKAFLEEQFARAKQETAAQFGQVAEQFGQVAEQFAEVHVRLTTMEENMEEKIHLTQVAVEGMRGDIRVVAEGVMAINERLEVFQEATAKNFKMTEASIAPYYKELDGRVRVLEARAERQTTDVIEAIRQKFGKSQDS